jgi:outer membrane protein assembly factor BamB
VWKSDGRGEGYSTPTVAGGRLYGMGNVGDQETVWAVDAAGGKQVWSTPVVPKPRRGGGGYDGPRSSPTIDGDRLYAVGLAGDLVCLETAGGKEQWRKSYRNDFNGRIPSWGFSESPLVDGDRVIVTPGGTDAALVALDKTSGKVVWKAKVPDAGGAGYASVMPVTVGKTKLYVTWLGRTFVGVGAADGRLLFRYETIANGTANIPTPVIRGEYVFCTSGYTDGGSALLKLKESAGGVDFEEVWQKPSRQLQNHHGGVVLVGDHLYFGHGHSRGNPVCVEFLTGKPAWGPSDGPGRGSAAVLWADGKLYFRYQDGTLALIDATPAALKVVSKFALPDQSGKPSWPHPVIAGGKLYIRDQDVLHCFNVKK